MASEEKRKYDREYHSQRSPEKKRRKIELQAARAHRNILALRSHKEKTGCAVCGEKDPIVLEFNHLDMATKSFNLGESARLGMSLENLMREVEKCEILCANCHKRKTAKQLNWRV